MYISVYTVDTGWKYESYGTTLNANYEHELVLSIQQVMSTLLMQVQPKLILIQAVLTGLVYFTSVETIKTTNQSVKSKYYSQVNSYAMQGDNFLSDSIGSTEPDISLRSNFVCLANSI